MIRKIKRVADKIELYPFLVLSITIVYPIILGLAIVAYEGFNKGILLWLAWGTVAWCGAYLLQIGAWWLRWKINHKKAWWQGSKDSW